MPGKENNPQVPDGVDEDDEEYDNPEPPVVGTSRPRSSAILMPRKTNAQKQLDIMFPVDKILKEINKAVPNSEIFKNLSEELKVAKKILDEKLAKTNTEIPQEIEDAIINGLLKKGDDREIDHSYEIIGFILDIKPIIKKITEELSTHAHEAKLIENLKNLKNLDNLEMALRTKAQALQKIGTQESLIPPVAVPLANDPTPSAAPKLDQSERSFLTQPAANKALSDYIKDPRKKREKLILLDGFIFFIQKDNKTPLCCIRENEIQNARKGEEIQDWVSYTDYCFYKSSLKSIDCVAKEIPSTFNFDQNMAREIAQQDGKIKESWALYKKWLKEETKSTWKGFYEKNKTENQRQASKQTPPISMPSPLLCKMKTSTPLQTPDPVYGTPQDHLGEIPAYDTPEGVLGVVGQDRDDTGHYTEVRFDPGQIKKRPGGGNSSDC